MPDVVLVTPEQLNWMREFKDRPARNLMMESSGYSYNRFDGFEPLGYRRAETIRPELTWLTNIPWLPGYQESSSIVGTPRADRATLSRFKFASSPVAGRMRRRNRSQFVIALLVVSLSVNVLGVAYVCLRVARKGGVRHAGTARPT